MGAEKVSVVSPAASGAGKRAHAAPRLDALDGKTICEVWNGVFKGDVTFPLIRERLTTQYRGLRIIPYTQFPHTYGSDDPVRQREHAQRIAALVREAGCDAVISGNGA